MTRIRVGSRGSPLALRQAEIVCGELERRHPGVTTGIRVIRTSGDQPRPEPQYAGLSVKRMFVKEIEDALLQEEIDLAVHSLKDLPSELPPGLCLAAIPEREDPRDALVSSLAVRSPREIRRNGRIGTSSLRRTVQLRLLRPDLEILPLRGNVGTRIRKMKEQRLDGIVLAAAGLKRLGLEDRIAFTFSQDQMLSAIGQGALAVECRCDDRQTRELLAALDHPPTRVCTDAERRFLERMGGGCQVPMGAHASLTSDGSEFQAVLASPYRPISLRHRVHGPEEELPQMALDAAESILSRGGGEILRELEERGPA